jgi:sialate O-acetylesterase
MHSPRSALFLLLTALLALDARADVRPSALFQDHAILQRDKPVPVWGLADPGEHVRVTFAGQSVTATAGSDGKWRADLAPLPASATPATLTIAGNNTLTFSDVLVGEVWLASGQSNMEWSVEKSNDADLLKLTARAFPAVREIKVGRKVSADAVTEFTGEWKPSSPDTVGSFSAAAHTFARDLHLALGVPVGIVQSSWGGTPVESWLSPAALAATPHAEKVAARWQQLLARHPAEQAAFEKRHTAWTAARDRAAAEKKPFNQAEPRAPQGPSSPHRPSALYQGMIHPLLPCAVRGFLWYQGESNGGRAAEYADLFPALIKNWRADFAQGDLPFYWVQIASYKNNQPDGLDWPALREAQTRTLALPATGQVVTMDIGDFTDIHPKAKTEVGHRLARLALRRTYGFTELADSGPVFSGFEITPGDPAATPPRAGSITVSFENTSNGLRHPAAALAGLELAGEDRVFRPASARIAGVKVVVTSPDVPSPVAVRYAWRNYSPAALCDNLGLPVPPFRTDAW